jgi:protoporphyrinogen oxidase
MKVAIIGAGISGISAGKLLTARNAEVVIFEKNARPGGLVNCDWVDGNLFHKVGGHVFNSKNPDVLKWFWDFFDRDHEFLRARRNAKILLNGKLIGYPIENHLYQLDQSDLDIVVDELLQKSGDGYTGPDSYSNFEAFLKGNFGARLYDLYFGPYNEKLWRNALHAVPLEWLDGKLPMPDYKRIFLSNIARQEESEMVHSTFFYPKKGGSQFIIDRLAEGLSVRTDCIASNGR